MGNDGYITIGTKIDTSGFESDFKGMKNSLEGKMSSMEKTITKTFNIIKTGIVGAGIAMAFKAISNNLDGAIKRLDTLKNYTKVMSNLGISAEDANASMERLSDALTGLPTTMDDAVASVQRFTSANGNIAASTEMFLALNNAVLAGGANAQTQASAIEQLSQAYSKGKPDMMEWRTALTAMPAQLKQVAISMGYVSADELGEALRSGRVSMNEFMLQLIKLNKEGVAGFQSFEEQARNSTGGIATSIQNVKTAITRGIASILDAIGQANIAGFFQAITRVINKTIPYIVAFIKLVGTAINYVASLFGKQVSTSAENVTENVSTANDAVENLGSSIENTNENMNDTTKSAKGLKKALSNLQQFDELNVLQSTSDSGAGGAEAGAGANALNNMDLSGLTLELKDADKTTGNLLDNLTSKFKEITDLFSEGFKLSFGNTNFNNILGHLTSIKDTLLNIGTDPMILNSARNWAKTLVSSLGSVTGSVARIGTNVAEFYYGAIDTYLKQNSGRITEFVTSMFDISSENIDLTAQVLQVLGELSDVFASDTAKQIGANVLSAIYNPLRKLYETFYKLQVDFKRLIFQPIIDNSEGLKNALKGNMEVIEKVTGTLSDMFTTAGDTIGRVYDEHIHPVFEKLTSAISDSIGKFLEVYNAEIKPILDDVANKFDELWQERLKPAFEKIADAIGTVFDLLGIFCTQILKPIIDWIIANVIPVIVDILAVGLKGIFEIIGDIGDTLGGLADIVKGVAEVLIGLFTFDWEKIGEGLKNIFSGFKDVKKSLKNIEKTISKTFKAMIETLLDWIYDKFVEPVEDYFTNLWETVENVIEDFIYDVKDLFSSWGEWIDKNIITPIKNKMTGIWDAIKNGATKVIEEIKTLLSNMREWINTNIVERVKGIFYNMWNAIKNKAEEIINNIKSTLERWAGWIDTNIVSKIKTVFTNLWDGIKNAVNTTWSNIKTTLTNAYNWINTYIIKPVKNAFNTVWNTLKTGASNAWQGVKNVFSTVTTFFKNTFSNAWNAVKRVFDKGGQVFNSIKESISSTFKNIVNHLVDGINKVVSLPFNKINDMLNTLRWTWIFGQRPFADVPSIPVPQIPKLAKGTILNAPGKGTLVAGGTAIAGEAGREAYLPLSDKQLLEELGSTIGKYITINATIENSMNGRVLSRELRRVQNEQDFAYNV